MYLSASSHSSLFDFVSRHGSVFIIYFSPLPTAHFSLRFVSPLYTPFRHSETPPFYFLTTPKFCRIRHSLLVMLLYHYLIAQMFCGSLCMSYRAILRNIYRGWPLDWCQRPHGRCITLRDVYVFAKALCYWAAPFVRPTRKLVHFTPNLFDWISLLFMLYKSLIAMR